MNDVVLTPAEFVALLNQTLEAAFPLVVIEGELSELRIRKNQWVYFKLKDDEAVVDFFGSVYQLKQPLEDGMLVRAVARPRLSPRYGFSLSFESVTPVGEGAIKRAYELLRAKLEAEGLFAIERKRTLPALPRVIGLISSRQAAGAEDFLKVLSARWGDMEVRFASVAVQGAEAPLQISRALDYFNQHDAEAEVLVLVRGGGSAEDLAAYNDEALVRAVAASRIPTLSGIGHEQDVSLVDLAADYRAATPTEAAVVLVPDQEQIQRQLAITRTRLQNYIQSLVGELQTRYRQKLSGSIERMLDGLQFQLDGWSRTLGGYNPQAVLARGYSIITKNGRVVSRASQVKARDRLLAKLSDGQIETEVINAKAN